MKESNLYTKLQQVVEKNHQEKNGNQKIDLGRKIRELREKVGMSGAELCRRSGGIDPRTLNAIEKGRIRTPSIDTLQAIAGGLGCLVRDLFTQAELKVGQNYHLGSSKGTFQIEFPKNGIKIISVIPAIPQFFCGKIILNAQGRVEEQFPVRSCPVFIEVIMGRVDFWIEDEKVTLKEGENILFNGGMEHKIHNPLNRESVLWMVTAPSFFRS